MSAAAAVEAGGAELVRTVLRRRRRPCVVTMGTFDGVHAGHRALVGAARDLSATRGLPVTAVTFSPRPERVLRPHDALPDLCPVAVRAALLREAGADDVVVLPFSTAIARIATPRFARLLVDELGLRILCVGEDFALGRGRGGDVATLRALGLEVVTLPLVRDRDGGKISSSRLRAEAAARRARPAAA
jgi:FAD synthase